MPKQKPGRAAGRNGASTPSPVGYPFPQHQVQVSCDAWVPNVSRVYISAPVSRTAPHHSVQSFGSESQRHQAGRCASSSEPTAKLNRLRRHGTDKQAGGFKYSTLYTDLQRMTQSALSSPNPSAQFRHALLRLGVNTTDLDALMEAMAIEPNSPLAQPLDDTQKGLATLRQQPFFGEGESSSRAGDISPTPRIVSRPAGVVTPRHREHLTAPGSPAAPIWSQPSAAVSHFDPAESALLMAQRSMTRSSSTRDNAGDISPRIVSRPGGGVTPHHREHLTSPGSPAPSIRSQPSARVAHFDPTESAWLMAQRSTTRSSSTRDSSAQATGSLSSTRQPAIQYPPPPPALQTFRDHLLRADNSRMYELLRGRQSPLSTFLAQATSSPRSTPTRNTTS